MCATRNASVPCSNVTIGVVLLIPAIPSSIAIAIGIVISFVFEVGYRLVIKSFHRLNRSQLVQVRLNLGALV